MITYTVPVGSLVYRTTDDFDAQKGAIWSKGMQATREAIYTTDDVVTPLPADWKGAWRVFRLPDDAAPWRYVAVPIKHVKTRQVIDP